MNFAEVTLTESDNDSDQSEAYIFISLFLLSSRLSHICLLFISVQVYFFNSTVCVCHDVL